MMLLWWQRCSNDATKASRLLWQQRDGGDAAVVACNGSNALWRFYGTLLWQRRDHGDAAAVATTQWQPRSCCGNNPAAAAATWLLWRRHATM